MDVEPTSHKPFTKPGVNSLTHAMHYKLKHSWLTLSHNHFFTYQKSSRKAQLGVINVQAHI